MVYDVLIWKTKNMLKIKGYKGQIVRYFQNFPQGRGKKLTSFFQNIAKKGWEGLFKSKL